ncbi:MAG TPA: phospholipase D family protein [Gaiellaceae bacterium]|jgi:phosphatidylserine/phosphatidylglycerophosphate/cardiolipin synthase-like enzyme|nr:phospholipase D family protein [Gaiellaceae bacterium]
MQIDDRVGDAIERAIGAHHRRRLRRLGWAHALDGQGPAWARGDPPPRSGNAVEVLADGAEALPRIAEELRHAASHVRLAGWHVTPTFRLGPSPEDELQAILAEIAERVPVRVLLWAGAPVPLFRPSRSDVRELRDTLERGTRIRVGLDERERPMHCHHEKLVVVDDRVAFVGGIDLTSYAGDRFDTNDHPARGELGWHDAAVRLEGPVVADVTEHFAFRWREVTGEAVAAPAPPRAAGGLDVQLVRTVPEGIYDALPRGDFRILEGYVGALRGAERLVYLESQFLWSPEIVAILAKKLREPPTDGFRVVVLLPARPNDGADDTRGQLGVLAEADDGRGRLLACTLRQRGPDAKLVYVHAKIGIVDDAWLTLGSANLNEHSLFNDTEVNVVVRDSALVRQTRLRLWAEHLERDPGELEGDPTEVVDGLWRPLADEPDHRLARLRHVSRRSKRLVGPLRSLVVDGCALKSRPPGSDSSTVRKIAPLLLVPFLAAACGGGSLSAAGAEHYLRTTAGVPHAHCRPGHSGWSYVCTVRRAKRAFRVAVVVDGRRVKETTELLPLRGPLPPVPGSPEARVAEFLADASAICSRRTTLVAAIPHPRNVYAAYRLMGAYMSAEREEAESLRRLDPPGDSAEAMRRLISAADRAVAAAEAYRTALLHRDRTGVARALAARRAAASEQERAAVALDLRCVAVTR